MFKADCISVWEDALTREPLPDCECMHALLLVQRSFSVY